MKNVVLKQKDGSEGKMTRSDIEIDKEDPRKKGKRRQMLYKFWLYISSTDIQVSIETFHTRHRTHKMVVAQSLISMTDKGEFESAALPEEYENLLASRDVFGDASEEADEGRHSGPFSNISRRAGRSAQHHFEGKALQNLDNLEGNAAAQLVDTRSYGQHSIYDDEGESSLKTSFRAILHPTSSARKKRTLEESSSENIQTQVSAPQLQGIAFAAQTMLGDGLKRVGIADSVCNLTESPVTGLGTVSERGRHAASPLVGADSRASSRYRTRSSTPRGSSDQVHQLRKTSDFLESQVRVPTLVSLKGE
jgi:hypothetical protein